MERCTSCGSELPGAAQFCGYCGRVVITVKEMPTSMSGHPAVNAVEEHMPTSISGSSHTLHGSLRSAAYSSTGSIWSKGEMTRQIPASEEEEYEEEERRRALFGLPLLGPLAGGQPPANTPMVQGTPQFSNVPVVQGNRGGPSPVPALQGAPLPTPSLFAPASAPYTPPPLPNPESWPPSYPTAPLTNPSSSPKQTGSGNASNRPGSGRSCALTGLILAAVFLVIIGTIGGLLFGVPPAISHFGSSNKIPPTLKGQAKLKVTPEALNFGALDAGQKLMKGVTVSNSGSLALDWKVNAASANWVSVDTTSQTIQPGALPDTIQVRVDTANLAAGNQSAKITISSNGGSAQVAITLLVNQSKPTPAQPPCTLSAPSSSNETFHAGMGSDPAAHTLTIGASGSCSSRVTITPTVTTASGTGWLAVSPSAATLTNGSATFTVTVTSSRLSPGSYTGSISLAAKSGNSAISGSPQTVGVTLTVTEVPPVLAVSPGALAFSLSNGDSTAERAFTISNTGGAPLNWTATLNANAPRFVSLSQGTGTNLSAGANTGVKVDVNPSRVEAGNYTATVTVSATDPLTGQSVKGSPATVPVTITITVPPSMQLSTTSLTFTPNSCVYTASGDITLKNTGGGTLSWTVGDPVYPAGQPTGWLSVTPSGKGSGDARLDFTADGSGSRIASGKTYTATVTITPSVGDAQTVTVSYTYYCIQ